MREVPSNIPQQYGIATKLEAAHMAKVPAASLILANALVTRPDPTIDTRNLAAERRFKKVSKDSTQIKMG